jgi:xyloglucan-specific exo-beta-1,4-glucanase
MNNKYCVIVPALLAALLAGCGGGDADRGAALSATSLRAEGGKMASSATTWRSVKFGGGGYVTGLIFHPTSPHVLYARTDIGGAYRWNQQTSSWVPITDGAGFGAAESFYHGIESIAVDPTNDQLVYMAAGMYNSADATGRLYISRDRGDHWTHVDLPFSTGGNNNGRAMGERLMVDPNLPSTLFYGSRTAGLWKSTDSGLTWNQVTTLSSAKLTGDQINALGYSAMGVELVVYDTGIHGRHKDNGKNPPKDTGAATQTIYTAIAPDYVNVAGLTSNLYKSTDGGATWAPVATPVSGYHIPHMVRADDGMFYVAFTHGAGPGDGGPGRLYKFDGSNWTLLNSFDNFGIGSVSVQGSGATTRIALGVSGSWGNWRGQPVVRLSDDGGATWREIEATMPHTPVDGGFSGWVDDIEIDPANRDHIMHIHGGGIWETWNASSATPSWNEAITDLEETAALAIVTPPAGAPYKLINSSGDVGTWIDTDLATKPTLGPTTNWSSGNSADMAWSDPLYIAGIGAANWSGGAGFGFWSGDGGKTWANFATLPPGAAANPSNESNIAVTTRNNAIWAPANSVPSYTADNGASWIATNLPPLSGVGINRGYRVAADRKNPNKVYAYDSGGSWWNQWSDTAHFWYSADGGHTFSERTAFKGTSPMVTSYGNVSLAVNPNVEGDIWLADGNAVYHSLDSGATWTKLSNFASNWGSHATWSWPEVQGASVVALGKAAPGSSYSAAIYVVGVVNGVWGVYRSDDGGASWTRFNDDAHQFGGIGVMAADQGLYGRIYVSGTGRGLLYSN